uniref:Uncharacterized protein n=1 Tax=Rhizophora mucronata TaxID=61149 RepID=A0A2P2R344_RHIMU
MSPMPCSMVKLHWNTAEEMDIIE